MSRLDYLVTKLNLHGVNPEPSPGRATAAPGLRQNDVYAALGLGLLPYTSYIIGLAVHTQEQRTIEHAVIVATLIVDRWFHMRKWSATKPFQTQINGSVRRGEMTAADAKTAKLLAGEKLKKNLASLAINELLSNDICQKCGGTGYIQGKLHIACHGTGKRKRPDVYNANQCGIGEDAWRKTWRHRYQLVRGMVADHLNRFEQHLERYS
jgi:hypothetical protein